MLYPHLWLSYPISGCGTLQGLPLNDTRQNRALSARAPDRRLESVVGPSIAWLGVNMEGLEGLLDSTLAGLLVVSMCCCVPGAILGDDPLLVGELRQCSLTITNHGDTPLTGLLIKPQNSAVWVSLGDDPSGAVALVTPPLSLLLLDSLPCLWPTGDSGSPLGLDGSLLRVRLPADGLAPHTSAVVPVVIRACRAGLHSLAMLIVYETTLGSAAAEAKPTVVKRSIKWVSKVRQPVPYWPNRCV